MQEQTYKIEENRFVIENPNEATPFADFFPGIAGKFGVPLWIYFVSRGQGIISMGLGTKDHPIMEFQSMNRALANVERHGFRTFLKINGQLHEPFRPIKTANILQRMTISAGELELQELDESSGLVTSVLYYPLVESPVPALIRRVRFKNRGKQPLKLEILDGLPRIIPYGMDRHCLNAIPRHIEGMIEVAEAGGLPLFRLKQAHADVERIELLTGGNFLFSIGNGSLLKKSTIVDPEVVFGDLFRLDHPAAFEKQSALQLAGANQVRFNRTPCALTATECELAPGEGYDLTTCVGFVREDAQLEKFARQAARGDFLIQKRQANLELLGKIKDNALTVSSHREFDEFIGQMFLDNVIRGGMPVPFETAAGRSAFYLYSRQNGDLERDYHEIVLEPTYFSQGTGHYRSVNQNRRMDCWFFPDVQDYNIHLFMSLIQTDGYNPLEVGSVSYRLTDEKELEKALKERMPNAEQRGQLRAFLAEGFTPGRLVMHLETQGVSRKEWERILTIVMAHAVERDIGTIHEGFWIDHWHYNLDLIDTFLMMYPDQLQALLLGRNNYTFFDNPDVLLPRDEKYVNVDDRIRQYDAVYRDPQKEKLIASRAQDAYRTRVSYGKGRVYSTNLFSKLVCLAANRIAALDPQGLGIEMEADKPGWNDSMNGLPGILGSSLGESFEVERLCRFLLESLTQVDLTGYKVYEDLQQFVKKLIPIIQKRVKAGPKGAFAFWDAAHTAREKYLEQTRYGVSGQEKPLTVKELTSFLEGCLSILSDIRGRALKSKAFDKQGIPYTYFENQVVGFATLGTKTKPKLNAAGYPLVKAKKFSARPLPLFLEGPMHYLRVHPENAQSVYEAIKASPVYDEELEMFKVSESLAEETFEIGRVKAWPAGWIENESVYTHMVYKFLLEVLRSGLATEYFRDVKTHLTPFLDPSRYGRSIFQNVSFIVSSAYADKSRHGQGFQARLSGVTSEMLHLWTMMTAGPKPFWLTEQGELRFTLRPMLAGWIFTTHSVPFTYRDRVRIHEIEIPRNSFAFRFAGNTLIVYRNDARKNTYQDGSRVESYLIQYRDGTVKEVKSDTLDDKQARDLRAGKIFRIDAVL